MTTRPIAIVLLTSLLSTTTAVADRSTKRTGRRVADVEEKADKDDDQDGPEATSVLPIKLAALIEVAVRLSPELALSKNDRLVARGKADASRKDQEWVVGANGKLERYAFSPDVDVGAFQTAAENKLTASLSINRNLPTGGSIGLEISIIDATRELQLPAGLGKLMGDDIAAKVPADAQNGDFITDEYTLIQSQAKLIFTQPLARKFGRDVALAEQTKGDLAFSAATVKTQLAAEEMLRDLVSEYWELAYASFEVDTRAEALATAKKQEETTRVEIRAKLAPATALSTVLFEIATREEALLAAKNTWEKKSLDVRKRAGLEISRRDLVIRPKDAFEADDDEWDVDEVLKRAHKSNRRVAALILEKRSADVDVKVAKNGMLPVVDFSVSGALVGSGNTTDSALAGAAASNGYQVMGSLTVQFEIGGAAKGAHDAALAKRQRVEIDQADTARKLDTDVVHAVHAVKAARARVVLADKAILLAEENVKGERANLQTGTGTNGATHYTLMQRLNDVSSAKLRKGRAIADYHVAVANVQFLGGMLLEQYRVNVRPLPRGR